MNPLVFLADKRLEAFRSLGSEFRADSSRMDGWDIVIGFGVGLVFGIGLFILARLAKRQDKNRRFNSPQALYRELCEAHGLDRASARLLMQMAKEQDLQHPARLFLEPARFNPENLSPALRGRQQRIRELRRTIFSGMITPAALTGPQLEPSGESANEEEVLSQVQQLAALSGKLRREKGSPASERPPKSAGKPSAGN